MNMLNSTSRDKSMESSLIHNYEYREWDTDTILIHQLPTNNGFRLSQIIQPVYN